MGFADALKAPADPEPRSTMNDLNTVQLIRYLAAKVTPRTDGMSFGMWQNQVIQMANYIKTGSF